MYSKIAISACRLVFQNRHQINSALMVFKNVSSAALSVNFHSKVTQAWSEPHELDHIAPFELSRFLGKQGFEFLWGSVAEG